MRTSINSEAAFLRPFCLLFPLLFIGFAQAQTLSPDTAFISLAKRNAVSHYLEKAQVENQLINGAEYFDYKNYLHKGHQFFLTDEFVDGAVLYDGTWHHNVPLLYDIVTDELVLSYPGSVYKYKLANEKVSSFKLNGHTFRNIKQAEIDNKQLIPGFYDVLIDGRVKLLGKHTKLNQTETKDGRVRDVFIEYTRFFVWDEGRYNEVGSKNSVLNLFQNRKPQLQKFIKEENLRFKKDRLGALSKLVAYYNELLGA